MISVSVALSKPRAAQRASSPPTGYMRCVLCNARATRVHTRAISGCAFARERSFARAFDSFASKLVAFARTRAQRCEPSRECVRRRRGELARQYDCDPRSTQLPGERRRRTFALSALLGRALGGRPIEGMCIKSAAAAADGARR